MAGRDGSAGLVTVEASRCGRSLPPLVRSYPYVVVAGPAVARWSVTVSRLPAESYVKDFQYGAIPPTPAVVGSVAQSVLAVHALFRRRCPS